MINEERSFHPSSQDLYNYRSIPDKKLNLSSILSPFHSDFFFHFLKNASFQMDFFSKKSTITVKVAFSLDTS